MVVVEKKWLTLTPGFVDRGLFVDKPNSSQLSPSLNTNPPYSYYDAIVLSRGIIIWDEHERSLHVDEHREHDELFLVELDPQHGVRSCRPEHEYERHSRSDGIEFRAWNGPKRSGDVQAEYQSCVAVRRAHRKTRKVCCDGHVSSPIIFRS